MSLINREELLRRLKLHGRRKDGKTVIPEWMQVAIKEVEHMPEDTTTKLAYWEVGTDVDDTLPFAPEYYWFGIFLQVLSLRFCNSQHPLQMPSVPKHHAERNPHRSWAFSCWRTVYGYSSYPAGN